MKLFLIVGMVVAILYFVMRQSNTLANITSSPATGSLPENAPSIAAHYQQTVDSGLVGYRATVGVAPRIVITKGSMML